MTGNTGGIHEYRILREFDQSFFFLFSLSLSLNLTSSLFTRDSKRQRTRETRARDTRPFAGDSLREKRSLVSFSLPFPVFNSLSFYFVLFLSHTCLLSFSPSTRCSSPPLSLFASSSFPPLLLFLFLSFPFVLLPQIQLLLPFVYLAIFPISFFLSFPRNERVPRNRSMGFKTIVLHGARVRHALRKNELPTRREQRTASRESTYVRSPIQPPIHAPTRTHARGGRRGETQRESSRAKGGRERQLERKRKIGTSLSRRKGDGEHAPARVKE